MMKLTKPLRRKITDDWHRLFPEMGILRSMWIARRVGPLVQGVCLDGDSANASYFPTTHLHNLCRPFPAVSLTLGQRLLSERTRTEERIYAQFHEQHYLEAARRLTQASLLSLTGDLTLAQILDAYRGYRELRQPDSKYPVVLFEDGILLAAYSLHVDKAKGLLRDCVGEMGNWPAFVMERDGGIEAWERRMESWLKEPQSLRETADSQADLLRVTNLPVGRLLA
jgi:hypothetical protein